MFSLRLVKGVYRVRLVVPPELRPIIGKESLIKSLGTSDRAEANRLAAPCVVDFKARVARARLCKLGFRDPIPLHDRVKLRATDKYRRTPWGIRLADAGDIFGFPPDTRVPQIVTYSKGRAYARAGDEWLLG